MTGAARERFERLDALRGVAIVWMAGFHFSFDLNFYQLLHPRQNFYGDPFWTVQRSCIVSLFLFCAGLGQAAQRVDPVVPGRRLHQPWAATRSDLLCSLFSALR